MRMASTGSSLIGSAFSDIVANLGFGASSLAGATVGEALGRLLAGRAERARSILLDELRKGLRLPNDPGETDEFVAILYRYLRAAQEGAARLNLRLMARVIRNQIEREGLYADTFLRYAELIASLTREEVILLATRYRLRREFDSEKQSSDWQDTGRVNDRVLKALVPQVFSTPLDMVAALTALQRTGLVWPAAATTGGGFVWQDTPLLNVLAELAEFEDALRSEVG